MAVMEVHSLENFLEELLPADGVDAVEVQTAESMLDALAVLDGGGKMGAMKRGRREKKTTNSERCRRYRLKRQKEEEKLVYDNLNLKRERRTLKEQLETLQREVDQLVRLGDVNLHSQNELLRKELLVCKVCVLYGTYICMYSRQGITSFDVQGHQLYLEKVVSAIRAPFPFEPAEDQHYRAMTNGIDHAVNIVVGAMYNSMTDSTWKVGKPFELKSGMFCRWMYQLLPLGSSISEATRLNIRMDVENLPYPAKVLEKYVWQYMKDPPSSLDPDLPADTYKERYWFNHIICEDISAPKSYAGERKVEWSRVMLPKEDPVKEVVVVHSSKEVDIYPMAYLQDSRLAQASEPLLSSSKCKMVVSTNLKEGVEVPGLNSNLERIDSNFS